MTFRRVVCMTCDACGDAIEPGQSPPLFDGVTLKHADCTEADPNPVCGGCFLVFSRNGACGCPC